jgi:polysaccharide export outer membrane protein
VPLVGPHAVLQWTVESTKDKQAPPVQGQSVVGDDGRVDLGPYGSLSVAGLTPQQASDAIMRHMAQYLRAPHVHLTVTAPVAVMGSPRTPAGPTQTARRVEGFNQPPQRYGVRPAGYAKDGPDIGDPAFQPQPMPKGPPLEGAPYKVADKAGEKADDKDKPKDTGADAAAVLPPIVPGTGADIHPVHDGPAPYELVKQPLPPYVIEPPDVLLIEIAAEHLEKQPIAGQFLVRPDGTVNLGIYGSVFVTGLTIEQAKAVIASYLTNLPYLKKPVKVEQVNLDVLTYNSKWYYVVTDGAGNGQQVTRLPITGNETVLDAISLINGLSPVSSTKKIWLARRVNDHGPNNILPVDWCGITQRGETATNYQVLPGDRIYIQSQCLVHFDTALAKLLSPAERVLGVTLLGSSTVNSIRSGRNTGLNSGLGTVR